MNDNQRRRDNGSNGGNNYRRQTQKPDVLPENKAEALKYLKIGERDQVTFAIFFNNAVNNIVNITKIKADIYEPDKVKEALGKTPQERLNKLSDFIWLFAVDKPDLDFKANDVKNYCMELVTKIYELRNFFSHFNYDNTNCFKFDRKIYILLEGMLLRQARQSALLPGCDAQIINDIRLFKDDRSKTEKELTRDGLIFLCAMFLYRDDAHEFCRQFNGLKRSDLYGRALIELFTFYSCRKGRQTLNADEWHFMNFAEIMGYLNTAPLVSNEFMSLEKERANLATLKAASEESEENRSRYDIFLRHREKFTSFALGFFDDFNYLPSLHYKRLDTSSNPGRSRYTFDKVDALRMNRYFVIDDGKAHFSFKPETHYGKVQIGELRGSISVAELKRMLFAVIRLGLAGELEAEIKNYFSNYHKLLERLLNLDESELTNANWDDYAGELTAITGTATEYLEKNFLETVTPYLGASLAKLFFPPEDWDKPDLKAELEKKLNAMVEYTYVVEKRIKTEKVSDGLKIRQLFNLFNFYIPNERKFRQLPLGEQHRGIEDYEYQLVHSMLGSYSTDPKKIWRHLENNRGKLFDEIKYLRRAKNLDELSIMAIQEARKLYRSKLEELSAGTVRPENVCRRFGIKMPNPELTCASVVNTILKIDIQKWKYSYDYENNSKRDKPRQLTSVAHIVPQINLPDGLTGRVLLAENILKTRSIEKDPAYNAGTSNYDFNLAYRELKTKIALRDFYDVSILVQWLKDNQSAPKNQVNNTKRNQIQKAVNAIKEFHNQDKLCWLMAEQYKITHMNKKFELPKGDNQPFSVYDYYDMPITVNVAGRKNNSIQAHINDLNKPMLFTLEENFAALANSLDPDQQQTVFDYNVLLMELRRIQAADRRVRRDLIPLFFQYEEKYSGGKKKFSEMLDNNIKFSPDEKQLINDLRNAVFHDKLYLKHEQVEQILEKNSISSGRNRAKR